jgi:Skp family chaperone for outer membrane proteins
MGIHKSIDSDVLSLDSISKGDEMEVIAPITALLIAAGTIFSAIYHSKSKAEITLQQHITKLDGDIDEMRKEHKESEERWQKKEIEWREKYDELKKSHEKEKRRGDRLENRIREMKKKMKG